MYDIALETFRNNGIGQKDHNNGVLLVVALQEKKLRIMV
ncbi:TPM domain-containing protein [Patescibacteria group bacterium]|nr:TPM domain-containing protein [Patescibacteria group bacterium]